MQANLSEQMQRALHEENMLSGLRCAPKYIPSKYLYDEKGSFLFEEITDLPEYYQTRTESSILKAKIERIKACFDRPTTLVELGSGSSKKTRILLDTIENIKSYVPIDISMDFLASTVRQLTEDYPHINVQGVIADYTHPFTLPDLGMEQKVFFFPGSTIGNFEPEEAVLFLRNIHAVMSPGDRFIIGMDRKKDVAVIEAAYNDRLGVTEAFNKNLLFRMNRELKLGFDETIFSHVSFYNVEKGRIEMHLRSEKSHSVRLGDEWVHFHQGEMIHTENSYKFDLSDMEELGRQSGFEVKEVLSDDKEYFSICIFEVPRV